MTAADITQAPDRIKPQAAQTDRAGPSMWPLVGLSIVVTLLVSLPNLADPMIRFDDFPAFFADPSGFWSKTLHEGRWVNYLWHLREVVTPAWLNFAVYQALWASFAAAMAVATLGRGGFGFFAIVLTLMIVVAPPAVLISLWFNTLVPGLALVALFAVLACYLSPRALRALLPLFTVLTFMAYTTYPLLLLAICLVRTERRSLTDLIALLALFTASFGAAVLATYALNWQVHGIFGVPLADWREAVPAEDVAGYLANLPKLTTSLTDFLTRSSYEFTPAVFFHLGLLGLSVLVLLRRAPLEGLYLLAGLVTGFTLVGVQVLKLGAIVPPRAFIFAWVLYAAIVVRAAQELSRTPAVTGRLARNAALLIVGSYLLQVAQQYVSYRAWQQETRAIGAAVADAAGPVLVLGDPKLSAAGKKAGVQNNLGFAYRMQQVTGQRVILCADDPAACAAAQASTGQGGTLPFAQVWQSDSGVIVRYP